jgi:hypothetical protein
MRGPGSNGALRGSAELFCTFFVTFLVRWKLDFCGGWREYMFFVLEEPRVRFWEGINK